MTEAEAKYRAFLRRTAQTVEEMLSGVVKTAGGQVARVDPQQVQDLFRGSVRSFVAWFRQHHRTENRISEADLDDAEPIEKPNPIDWPTAEGRKAFAGDRQLACCVATLVAIHDANKNPSVDVRGWPLVRAVFYRVIRDGLRPALKTEDEPPVYDRSVVKEALGRVGTHLAGGQRSEAAPNRIPDEATLEPKRIAELFGVPCEALRKRLVRLRERDHGCFIENPEAGPRDARYLYRMGSIRPIIEAMKTSGMRPARRKSP